MMDGHHYTCSCGHDSSCKPEQRDAASLALMAHLVLQIPPSSVRIESRRCQQVAGRPIQSEQFRTVHKRGTEGRLKDIILGLSAWRKQYEDCIKRNTRLTFNTRTAPNFPNSDTMTIPDSALTDSYCCHRTSRRASPLH